MTAINLHITTLSITSIILVSITEFGNSGIARGQGTNVTSSLTPEQKAAMCDHSNPKLKFVNSTESKICGIPPTSTNTTTGTEAVSHSSGP
jgi:hypothetical protein